MDSTSPRWNETMEWEVEDFANVSPKLKFSLTEKDGKYMFTDYTQVDLKKVKASQSGGGVWLEEGKEYTTQKSTSGLGQKPKLRLRVEIF